MVVIPPSKPNVPPITLQHNYDIVVNYDEERKVYSFSIKITKEQLDHLVETTKEYAVVNFDWQDDRLLEKKIIDLDNLSSRFVIRDLGHDGMAIYDLWLKQTLGISEAVKKLNGYNYHISKTYMMTAERQAAMQQHMKKQMEKQLRKEDSHE